VPRHKIEHINEFGRQPMRMIRFTLFILFVLAMIAIVVQENHLLNDSSIKKGSHIIPRESMLKGKNIPDVRKLSDEFNGDLFKWMGKTPQSLLNELGDPVRKDLSAYGYTWWIYKNSSDNRYIQFGILDNEIMTIFATGNKLDITPLEIGQDYDSIEKEFTFDKSVNYRQGISTYRLKLTNEDLDKKPLVKVTDDVFIQLYFDTTNNQLISIRVIHGDILLKHKPYEMSYRGNIEMEQKLAKKQWAEVEEGVEQQIFDLTNTIRKMYDKNILQWEESTHEVAFMHSKDMSQNNYFSHHDLEGKGLKDRLWNQNIIYSLAGENIAAEYTDAPAVITGWLNSEGHREALLNEDYTHLGVGVYRYYYTQNFISKD